MPVGVSADPSSIFLVIPDCHVTSIVLGGDVSVVGSIGENDFDFFQKTKFFGNSENV